MGKKTTAALMKELSADIKPVKKLGHPVLRALPWIFLGIFYLAGVVHYLGLRPDFATKVHETNYLFEIGIVTFIAISAALCSAWLCVPDMRGHKWMNAVPLTLLGGFILLEISRLVSEGFFMPDINWGHCHNDGVILGAVPAAFIVFIAKKGSTTQPLMMMGMNILAASGLSYVGLRLTCSMDTVGHSFLLHMLPFLAVGAVAGILARKIYKW